MKKVILRVIDVAKELETELFKVNKGNPKAYADKARSLIFNLMNPKNPNLKLRFLLQDKWTTTRTEDNGDIIEVLISPLDAATAIVMNPKELADPSLQEQRQKAIQH